MDKNFDKNFGWPFEENSRATISCVPKHLVNTPLLRDRYFFTLPKMLLDEISKEVGKSDGKGKGKFPKDVLDDLLKVEHELSGLFSNNRSVVGFWKEQRIWCPLFPQPHLDITPKMFEYSKQIGWTKNRAAFDDAMRIGDSPISEFKRVRQAFAGWLMVNDTFLNEHDKLLEDWADEIQTWGTRIVDVPFSDIAIAARSGGRSLCNGR